MWFSQIYTLNLAKIAQLFYIFYRKTFYKCDDDFQK